MKYLPSRAAEKTEARRRKELSDMRIAVPDSGVPVMRVDPRPRNIPRRPPPVSLDSPGYEEEEEERAGDGDMAGEGEREEERLPRYEAWVLPKYEDDVGRPVGSRRATMP